MRESFNSKKRIVIKVGTSTLTYPNGKINLSRMSRLAWVLSDLLNRDKEVVLVSSGAIAVGTARLNLAERPAEIKGKQAVSAVGQAILMQMYENFFMQYNQIIAQILLTKDVVKDPYLKENARNTFNALFDMRVIPICNENDTVSVEELGFSDNDALGSYVAGLIESDLLIMLSDIKGLCDCDPTIYPDAKMIDTVSKIDDNIKCLAGETKSKNGTGGMRTKLQAAGRAMNYGIDVVVASGANPEIIFDILAGEEIGTLFSGVCVS